LLVGLAWSCGSSKHATTTPTTIDAPVYTTTQQDDFYRDLAKSVPSLSPYVTQHGTAALDALLAYGAGFCALLKDGEDPSAAISNLQSQAQSLKSRTGFTGSQTTYETIATDSLIALCPSEQSLLTTAQLGQLQQVEHTLAGS
jgi:hypothetical protein